MSMKLICDQMLARLGRWLRAAGYDTVIVESSREDSEILKQALHEKRLLISRDRHFLAMPSASGHLIWLQSNKVQDCAEELSQKLPINWLHAPLTRCLVCNGVLEQAHEHEKKLVPEDVLKKSSLIWKCPLCLRVYWEGSHAKRILRTLNSWQLKRFG